MNFYEYPYSDVAKAARRREVTKIKSETERKKTETETGKEIRIGRASVIGTETEKATEGC